MTKGAQVKVNRSGGETGPEASSVRFLLLGFVGTERICVFGWRRMATNGQVGEAGV